MRASLEYTIRCLKNEAINGGDYTMVVICDIALYGPEGCTVSIAPFADVARLRKMSKEDAIAECIRVIRSEAEVK